MSTPERNKPCPCGSGKKHKHCCARKQTADAYEQKKRQSDEKLAGIPPTPDQAVGGHAIDHQVTLCLESIETTLKETNVDSIFKLADDAVAALNIAPGFSYAQLADAIDADDRFVIAKRQLICLTGGDPVKLYVKRLGF